MHFPLSTFFMLLFSEFFITHPKYLGLLLGVTLLLRCCRRLKSADLFLPSWLKLIIFLRMPSRRTSSSFAVGIQVYSASAPRRFAWPACATAGASHCSTRDRTVWAQYYQVQTTALSVVGLQHLSGTGRAQRRSERAAAAFISSLMARARHPAHAKDERESSTWLLVG